MKRITNIAAALFIAILMLVPYSSLGEATAYYFNPDGGKYYHVRRDCEMVNEKYRGIMLEIKPEQLAEESYNHLKPCPVCFPDKTLSPVVTYENPYVMYYRSPYNTAEDDVMISTAGTYRAGEKLKAGIYTAEADIQCSGTLIIETADKQPLYSYPLQGETSYTFYLGENMYISLPEHCILHKMVQDPQFQDPNEKVSIRQHRYMTMAEIPGNNYFVTNLKGEKGYFVVSSIQAETGEEEPARVDISSGAIVQLKLGQHYDVFVEFVNCVVWPCEAGEG
jgi:hypothetical protein